MTQFSVSEFIDRRKMLFQEFLNETEGLLNDLANNHFNLFESKLTARKSVLSKIISLDNEFQNSSENVDTSIIQVFSELNEKIKLAESTLISNLSLKIQQFSTEYQNRAKGLETLKSYRNSYFKENKETIGIV